MVGRILGLQLEHSHDALETLDLRLQLLPLADQTVLDLDVLLQKKNILKIVMLFKFVLRYLLMPIQQYVERKIQF